MGDTMIDASIALGVKSPQIEDPMNSYAKLMQMQHAQQQNQLGMMQMDEYKRGVTEKTNFLNALRDAGDDPLKQQRAYGMAGKLSDWVKMQHEQAQSTELGAKTAGHKVKTAKDTQDFMDAAKRNLSINPSDANVVAWGQDAVIKGFATADQAQAEVNRYLSMTPAQRVAEMRKAGSSVEQLTPKFETVQTPGGGLRIGSILDGSFTTTEALAPKVDANTAATISAANKRAADRLNAETATGKLDSSTIDFVAETYRQTGQMPPLGMGKEAAKIRQQILTRAAELTMGGGVSASDAAGSVVSNKQDIAGQSAAVKAFNTGVEGRSVRSFNTAIDHLDTMGKLADALQNNDIKAFNAVSQAFASQTGSAAPTNFDAAKAIVGGEVAKALTGANMALKDREEIRDSLKRANSPAQLKGVVRTLQELMGGQLSSLHTQYESSTKRKDFDTKLSSRSKDVVKTLTPLVPAGGVAPPAGFIVD